MTSYIIFIKDHQCPLLALLRHPHIVTFSFTKDNRKLSNSNILGDLLKLYEAEK